MSRLSLIEKALFLKKCELFQELDLDIILAIAEKTEFREFHDREVVFQEGQEAHRLFIVVSGAISADGMTIIEPCDYFGEEALFSQSTRHYSATAYRSTGLLAISRSHLDEILLECPQVALAMIRAFAEVTPFRERARTRS